MTKTCWGCDQELPREAFHNDKGKKDGLQSKCKKCQYDRYLERLAENPDRVRAIAAASQRKHRKRRAYGITNEQYDAMVDDQDGLCRICQRPAKLVCDHDHETGLLRGLLCAHCNSGLGQFRDDVDALVRAIVYLMPTGSTVTVSQPPIHMGLPGEPCVLCGVVLTNRTRGRRCLPLPVAATVES